MKVLFSYAIQMHPVSHLILSFPSPICITHTVRRNGTTSSAILNVFLLSPLDSQRLEVIRTIGGLGAVEKNTKVKTRIKIGVYLDHGPITTSLSAVDGEYESARNIADIADTTVRLFWCAVRCELAEALGVN